MKSTQIGLTNKYFLILVLALVFFVNSVSAFSNIVNMGEDGIELRNVAGAVHSYPSNWYCYGYFGGSGSENDACACDETRNNKVTCCDSIDDDGVWVKNFEVYSYGSISCTPLCISINGGWSITSFGDWSTCNLNGQRMRTLTQTCDNPTPNSCGQDCTTTSGWTRSGNIQTKTEVGSCAFCIDLDGDGYNSTGGVCGVVDCDDDNENINPGMQEICDNGLDDDCDGFIDSADSECDLPDFCIDGNVENYTFINNYCNGQDIWSNFSYSLCQSNNWLSRFNQSFNFSCSYGCLNGQCINQSGYGLSVNIIYPTNGTVFESNFSLYEINLNATSNQLINSWSINGDNYFDSSASFWFDVTQNISYGINNFTVCGTNENGTDCDFVFVVLKNDLNQTNPNLFIDIISPTNGTYNDDSVLLNISSNGTGIWYELNNLSAIYNDSLFLELEEGWNNLTAYAIDNEGNVVSDYVVFFIDLNNGNGGGDDDDCDDDCKNCDEEIENFDSIFMSDENIPIYLTQNNTNGVVLNNKNEFMFRDLILLLLLLILIFGIFILVILITRFLRNN